MKLPQHRLRDLNGERLPHFLLKKDFIFHLNSSGADVITFEPRTLNPEPISLGLRYDEFVKREM